MGAVTWAAGAAALQRWRERHQPLAQLLTFNRRFKTLIVFPLNSLGGTPSLGYVAAQDMLAVHHIDRALAEVGWPSDQTDMRGDSEFTIRDGSDREQNLVLISSPKSNIVTKQIMDELRPYLQCEFASVSDKSDHIELIFDGGHFPSPSYLQEETLRNEGKAAHEGVLEDYGIITRVDNPSATAATVLIVAGIRAIGTLGAAMHLRMHAKEIQGAVQDNHFVAMVKVTMKGWRIEKTETMSFFHILPDSSSTHVAPRRRRSRRRPSGWASVKRWFRQQHSPDSPA